MPAYLIQGFFFQNREWLDIDHRAEIEGGVGVIVREGLCTFMFSGVIFSDPDCESELIGEMSDRLGESKLFDVKITQEEVRFTKKYNRRDDTINYKFRREGEVWIGEYFGLATGRGDTKCIITEVPDSLFLPPERP